MVMIKSSAVALLLAATLGVSLPGHAQSQTAAQDVASQDVTSHYEAALKAFNTGQPNDAFVHLKNALQENPRHLPSKLLLASVYFDAGNLAAVTDTLNEALTLGADINLVLPLLGNALIMQKKVDELIALEKRYSEFTAQSRFDWALLKGQAFIIERNTSRAQAEFEKARAMFPEDVRALNTLATLYLNLGNLDKAAELTEASLLIEPENEKTWTLKGELALAKGDLSLAREHFERAFAIDGKDPKVLRQLVLVNLQQQRIDDARRYLALIQQHESDDPTAILISAWLLSTENQLDLAKDSLADLSSKLSVIDSRTLENAHYLLFVQGASDYLQGHLEKARTRLVAYLAKQPGDVGAMRMLLDIYLRTGQALAAVELLERNEEALTRDFGLSAQLLHLYLDRGKLFNAEQRLRQMKAGFADHPYLVLLEAQILKARQRPEDALDLLNHLQLGSEAPYRYFLLRGELELLLKQPEAAQKTAEALLARESRHPDILNFVAAVHILHHRLPEALAVLEQVLESQPKNLPARFNLAIVLKALGKADASVVKLKAILADQPEHTPSLLLLARQAREREAYEEAIDWLNKVLVYDLQNREVRELKAAILQQQENWPQALGVIKELLVLDRVNPQYLMQHASVLIRMEQYQEAQQPLNVLFGLWYDDAAQLQQLARLQVAARDLAGAEKSLNKAIEMAAKNASMRLDLARLNFINGNKDVAAQQLALVESRFGHSADGHVLAGDLASASGDAAQARRRYAQALALDPGAHLALVNLYQATQGGEGAEDFTRLAEKLVKGGGQPDWVMRLLADSYLNQGQWDRARQWYEQLLKTEAFGRDVEIYNNLANIYARTDLSKGLETAQAGMAINRRSPALLDTLGWILVQQGKPADALPYLRDAFAMNSASAETRYHLGYSLWKLGRKEEAVTELTAAVAKGKVFAQYQEAKALLESLKAQP